MFSECDLFLCYRKGIYRYLLSIKESLWEQGNVEERFINIKFFNLQRDICTVWWA